MLQLDKFWSLEYLDKNLKVQAHIEFLEKVLYEEKPRDQDSRKFWGSSLDKNEEILIVYHYHN